MTWQQETSRELSKLEVRKQSNAVIVIGIVATAILVALIILL